MMVSSGVAMEIHYCMGERAGADLYGAAAKKCGRCGMEEKKGCCNDEHKFYKLSDAHKNVLNDVSFDKNIPIINNVFFVYTTLLPTVELNQRYSDYSPPFPSGPPLYISNNVFRI
jgi:hypothetical protein